MWGAVSDGVDDGVSVCVGVDDAGLQPGSTWFRRFATMFSASPLLLAVMPAFTWDRTEGTRSTTGRSTTR